MVHAASQGIEVADADVSAIILGTAADGGERAQVERCEVRTETSMIATIRLHDGRQVPCVVKDVSKSGAKLGIPRGCRLPETFMFKMNGRDFIFQVALAWQRGRYAGVRIERVAKLPSGSRRG